MKYLDPKSGWVMRRWAESHRCGDILQVKTIRWHPRAEGQGRIVTKERFIERMILGVGS